LKKINDIEDWPLDEKTELRIMTDVLQFKEWSEKCPSICLAGQFISNYISLFDAYEFLKQHVEKKGKEGAT